MSIKNLSHKSIMRIGQTKLNSTFFKLDELAMNIAI